MKLNLLVAILLSAVAVPSVSASTSGSSSRTKDYQQGMVLSVERQEIRSPDLYYSGTDVSLQTEYYAYDVAVRVGCTTYHGRYETPFDYLPSAFGAGKSIRVRLAKHAMHFDVPGDSEFRLRGKERCLMAEDSVEQL